MKTGNFYKILLAISIIILMISFGLISRLGKQKFDVWQDQNAIFANIIEELKNENAVIMVGSATYARRYFDLSMENIFEANELFLHFYELNYSQEHFETPDNFITFAMCKPANTQNWEVRKEKIGYSWQYKKEEVAFSQLAEDIKKIYMWEMLIDQRAAPRWNLVEVLFYNHQVRKAMDVLFNQLLNYHWAVVEPSRYEELYYWGVLGGQIERLVDKFEYLQKRRDFDYLPENHERVKKAIDCSLAKTRRKLRQHSKFHVLYPHDHSSEYSFRYTSRNNEPCLWIPGRLTATFPLLSNEKEVEDKDSQYMILIYASGDRAVDVKPIIRVEAGSMEEEITISSKEIGFYPFITSLDNESENLKISFINNTVKENEEGEQETTNVYIYRIALIPI